MMVSAALQTCDKERIRRWQIQINAYGGSVVREQELFFHYLPLDSNVSRRPEPTRARSLGKALAPLLLRGQHQHGLELGVVVLPNLGSVPAEPQLATRADLGHELGHHCTLIDRV